MVFFFLQVSWTHSVVMSITWHNIGENEHDLFHGNMLAFMCRNRGKWNYSYLEAKIQTKDL